ncbi:Auxilin-related protein 2 [Bienertia sinuspersici]
MDDFGVLVQNFGIKPQGKSAPMASSKATSRTQTYSSVNLDPSFGTKPFPNSTRNANSGSGSFLNDQNDDIFGLDSSNRGNKYASSDVFDDVFQTPTNNTSSSGGGAGFGFDVESMYKGSMNFNSNSNSLDVNDDLIWGFSRKKSSNVAVETDDLLSSDPVDDLLGKLGKLGSDKKGSKGMNENKGKKVITDDLIPGFGKSNATNDRAQAASTEKSSGFSSLKELEDFATGRKKKVGKGHENGIPNTKEVKKTMNKSSEANFIDIEGSLNGDSVYIKKVEKVSEPMHSEEEPNLASFTSAHSKKSVTITEDLPMSSDFSSLEELEDFATGRSKNTTKGHVNGVSVKKEAKRTVSEKSAEANFIDIEGSLNGDSVYTNKVEMASEPMFPEEAPDLDSFFSAHTKKSVPVTEDTFMNKKANEVPADLFSGTTYKKEKKVSPANLPDDFSSIFGAPPVSGMFEEIEGESDERRRLRLERHRKATVRMEKALADLNQREYQAQQEQHERHRVAEAMEMEMKRWAAGKEGNLRALLSSLEQVLAPELGWRPVTLTDLITSSQVKLAYKKAALCVHPDKVQQKGASLEQKYVAEKAFDLLKEAWNKFNTEELR